MRRAIFRRRDGGRQRQWRHTASLIEGGRICLKAGDWDGAHALVQDDPSPEAAWVHAHLHRVEGDLSNARYWYRRAGRPEATESLEAERARLSVHWAVRRAVRRLTIR